MRAKKHGIGAFDFDKMMYMMTGKMGDEDNHSNNKVYEMFYILKKLNYQIIYCWYFLKEQMPKIDFDDDVKLQHLHYLIKSLLLFLKQIREVRGEIYVGNCLWC